MKDEMKGPVHDSDFGFGLRLGRGRRLGPNSENNLGLASGTSSKLATDFTAISDGLRVFALPPPH